ncbi:hypothetical protein CRP01_22705 [Flavilitoribacter nigricans DSM 23189 = NBRC 102662]|uniref:Uncharacterized protein n=1 Tax=Flavilitoribacter nigricans (strain ATCC 23147 / DSM 23189 / NBRC 102662 / NCIMB 1420 / SS-2) TaxID=1122177 RepID=A0A2D0N768_FLAN2|nr:hypothetical protein CRP01_22705 [Flavilitoribacter nigricans DSM 23189 = NBRC 102662]
MKIRFIQTVNRHFIGLLNTIQLLQIALCHTEKSILLENSQMNVLLERFPPSIASKVYLMPLSGLLQGEKKKG